MASGACRSSGFLISDTLVFSGRCKLTSIHAANVGAAVGGTPSFLPITLNLYDNIAASGKIVAKIQLASSDASTAGGALGTSIEFDMHNVICEIGLYADIVIPAACAGGHASANSAISGFTIEYS
jgi:hypothetical protein